MSEAWLASLDAYITREPECDGYAPQGRGALKYVGNLDDWELIRLTAEADQAVDESPRAVALRAEVARREAKSQWFADNWYSYQRAVAGGGVLSDDVWEQLRRVRG